MALTTKSELSEYCLRRLGKPVVDINVDIDQISDRIDDALEYFNQFHYDGIERLYLSHTITQADLDRAVGVNSETATEDSVSSVWTNQNNWIPIPDSVVSIVNVYHPSTAFGSNWYNQAAMIGTGLISLNSNQSLVSMEMFKNKLDLLDSIFNARSSLRFNHLSSKLYFDGDWDETFKVDETIIIECYRKTDPSVAVRLYNDMFLKRYATELIKRQWGQNLQKFKGIAMIGGVEIDADTIYTQAQEEIEKLEEKIISTYQAPLDFMIG
jgi:hypothetical protein